MMTDIPVSTNFSAAHSPDATNAAPALSAQEKLHLLYLFPSITRDADFAHASTVNKKLQAVPVGDCSGEKSLLDFATALRTEALKDRWAPTSTADIYLSGDIFKSLVIHLSRQEHIPEDLKGQPLAEALSFFSDTIIHNGAHARYKLACCLALEAEPILDLILDGKEEFDPIEIEMCLEVFHHAITQTLDLDSASFNYSYDELDQGSHGSSRMDNAEIHGTRVKADHTLKMVVGGSRKEAVKTIVHETNHTYQAQARLALGSYYLMRDQLTAAGKTISEAETYLHATAWDMKDIQFLVKKMCTSENYRFFAECMNLADKIYPEDTNIQTLEYRTNPLELQAFESEDSFQSFLEASPARRDSMKQRLEEQFMGERVDEDIRHEMLTALLKEIHDNASLASTPQAEANKIGNP